MGMAGKETAGDSSGGLESAGASGARKPCLESALSFLSPATPMGTAGWATQVGASGGFSWQVEASGGRTIGIFRRSLYFPSHAHLWSLACHVYFYNRWQHRGRRQPAQISACSRQKEEERKQELQDQVREGQQEEEASSECRLLFSLYF